MDKLSGLTVPFEGNYPEPQYEPHRDSQYQH